MFFQYDIHTEQKCCVANLKGDYLGNAIDENLLKSVENHLSSGPRSLVVGLSQLKYMNSCGINTLVRLVHLVKRYNAEIAFAEVPDKIRDLLEIMKLNSVLTIDDNVNDSIARLTDGKEN